MSILILFTNVVNAKGENFESITNEVNNAFPEDISSRQQVVEIYKDLLKTTNNKKSIYSSESCETVFTGDFAILEKLKNEDDTSQQIIYMKNETDMFANITYNENSGIYTLIEVDEESDDVLLMVEEEEFRIIQELDGSINLYSHNENILPVIEVMDDTGTEVRKKILSGDISSLGVFDSIDKDSLKTKSSYTFGPYGDTIGPYTKTNKVWVDVVTILGFTASGATIKASHPILGAIILIVSIGVFVGDKISQTFWIEYYQSFSLNPTYYYKYMLEEQDWYQYNNYTGYVGSSEIEKKLR